MFSLPQNCPLLAIGRNFFTQYAARTRTLPHTHTTHLCAAFYTKNNEMPQESFKCSSQSLSVMEYITKMLTRSHKDIKRSRKEGFLDKDGRVISGKTSIMEPVTGVIIWILYQCWVEVRTPRAHSQFMFLFIESCFFFIYSKEKQRGI